MKKKVLTVTIVAAIVAALMLVLTGCPTPPPAPVDEVAPTVTGITWGTTSATTVEVTVNATDNVGVVEVDATLTLGASVYTTTGTCTAATSVTVPLTFDVATQTSGDSVKATVTAVAKDAAGKVSTEKSVATTLTF